MDEGACPRKARAVRARWAWSAKPAVAAAAVDPDLPSADIRIGCARCSAVDGGQYVLAIPAQRPRPVAKITRGGAEPAPTPEHPVGPSG